MVCERCQTVAAEAAYLRAVLEMAQKNVRHEFDTCAAGGGPNASLGCLTCLIERVLVRTSPEVLRAAKLAPWYERGAAVLRGLVHDPAAAAIIVGMNAAEAEVTALLEGLRARAAESAASRDQRRREIEARRRALLGPAQPETLEAAVAPAPTRKLRRRK